METEMEKEEEEEVKEKKTLRQSAFLAEDEHHRVMPTRLCLANPALL